MDVSGHGHDEGCASRVLALQALAGGPSWALVTEGRDIDTFENVPGQLSSKGAPSLQPYLGEGAALHPQAACWQYQWRSIFQTLKEISKSEVILRVRLELATIKSLGRHRKGQHQVVQRLSF